MMCSIILGSSRHTVADHSLRFLRPERAQMEDDGRGMCCPRAEYVS